MIDPVFFPFTTVTAEQMEAVGRHFRPIGLYLPLEPPTPSTIDMYAAQGCLSLHIPIRGDARPLQNAVTQLRSWAAMHGVKALAAIKALEALPLWPPESPLALVQAITGVGDRSDQRSPIGNDLFQARLFLYLAQDLDQWQVELDQALDGLAAKERALYAMMHGEIHPSPANRAPAPDPGALLTARRLQAWARLVMASPLRPALMITTSQAVWDHLMEARSEARILPDPVQVKVPGSLMGILEQLAGEPFSRQAPGTDRQASDTRGTLPGLAIAVLDHCPPERFLAELAGAAAPCQSATPWTNTVLVRVQSTVHQMLDGPCQVR
jgi:hypothetical protein